jgi:hypothetical protein
MSHYSKINIVSEYITPNGYLFNGYSEKDLPEIFMQQLKKVVDFDVHIVRPNEEDKYHIMDVHSPFLNYVKEYKSKFHNIAHKKPIIELKTPSQIEDGELNEDVLNIFLAESDIRSAFKIYGLDKLTFSKKSLDLVRDNKNCVIVILDWREGSYRLPNDLINHFNNFMKTHNLKKTDLFLINNDFQIKSNQPKCNFLLGTFPWYVLIGFDERMLTKIDSTGREISVVTADEAFDAYSTIRPYKFLSYNRNSNRLHRPYVVSKLYNDDILKDSLVSLYESRALSEYDTVLKTINHLEFETLIFSNEDRQILKKFVDEVYPLKLDHDDADVCARGDNQVSTKDHFLNSYINIVCETSCHSEYTFITEKTLRPIINLQPFIIFGNPYTLLELKNLGFKTFDKWIDESYDNESNTNKRFELAYSEVKRLSEMDIDEIHELYYEMFDVLEHNFNRLVSIYKNYELPVYLGDSIYNNLKLI